MYAQFASGGVATYLFWRSAYLSTLFSLRNRTLVATDWLKTRLFGRYALFLLAIFVLTFPSVMSAGSECLRLLDSDHVGTRSFSPLPRYRQFTLRLR
jgi:hypothetical protein